MKAGDVNDARNRLAQQGIDANDIAFYGGVDNIDKKKSKSVEVRYIFYSYAIV